MTNLPRYAKRILVIIFDIVVCILSTWIAFYLRLEQFIKINDLSILAVLLSIFFAIPIFWFAGLYKAIFRFAGLSIIFTVAVATFIYSLFYFSVISVYGIPGIPRSIGIIQPVLIFLSISSSRIIIKYLFNINRNFRKLKNKKNVLIYGAGSSGRQILSSLENNHEMRVVGFLDDNKQFHNQTLLGQDIYKPSDIDKIIREKNVSLVLLALPSINRKQRNKIISDLNKIQVTVKTLPSIQDIVDGKITISDIKDLTIDDLLGREEIQPNLELFSKSIKSKVILVSGAGGSIGSEISRQIIKFNPKKILILDSSEFALYRINEELKNTSHRFEIIPLLINIQNESRLDEIFKIFKVDTVYHAAAYKHVSLVEENICESIKNNVFGTYIITKIALKNNVSNFVLISSDKAVRPTNIMGATKRLSEICVQALYYHEYKKTKVAIVRFGNVLQSSGSLIPKIKKQIKEGGPVTLTHPDVTRYFMTITEATQLVIQAAAMSEGCEVFVLDMGQSIKIKNLIHKMIKLSGLTIKNDENLDGDIEVKIIGLRPGEKLYEELLIGNNAQKTSHKKILKAQDPFIPLNHLVIDLDILSDFLDANKINEAKNMLIKLVPSYQSNTKIIDHIYTGQLNFHKNLKSSSIVNNSNDLKEKVTRIKST